jgi:hypothetical protein
MEVPSHKLIGQPIVVVIEEAAQTGHEKPDFYRIPTRHPPRGISKPQSEKSYLSYGGSDYEHYCDNDNEWAGPG